MTKTWIKGLESPHIVETAWERQMQVSGLEDYENARAGKDASSTIAGKKMILKLLKATEAGMTALQYEVMGQRRTTRSLKATVVAIPPETLALITLKEVIDKTYTTTRPEHGAGWQGLATNIASACETELNFRHWVSTSQEAARAYAKANGLTAIPQSMAERMIAERSNNPSQVFKWKNTIKELTEYQWELEEKHFCGDALLSCITATLPEHFTECLVGFSGGKKKFIRMTDEARGSFDRIEFSKAAAQCVKMPMLTTPRRWAVCE